MRRLAIAVVAALSTGALAQTGGPLPPGHPSVDGAGKSGSGSGALPPGHPSLDGAGKSGSGSGALPPGHPSLDGAGAAPGSMPPGHPPMRNGASPPSADELLRRLDSQADLKKQDKTFDVAVAIGKLYYSSARYVEAAQYLGQAWDKAERPRQIFLRSRKEGATPTAPLVCQEPMELKTITEMMEKYLAENNAVSAAGCGWAAMRPVLEAEEMRANALALAGDAGGAAASYKHVLELDRERERSIYGHAMALMEWRPDEVPALKEAKADLTRLLAIANSSPGNRLEWARHVAERLDQAIAAGGFSKLAAKETAERKAKGPPKTPPFVARMLERQQGGPGPGPMQSPSGPTPEQVRQMAEAAQNMQRTPEVEQGFAKLVEQGEDALAHGRYQDALDAYKRVVPFQPENGRAKAGMAWAMVGLNRQPMADRVWMVAVSGDPAAVDRLGDLLKQKGDAQGARALWAKLKTSAPDYAASAGLDRKLN